MRYTWFIILSLLIAPSIVQAASVAEASEVVLWYENESENTQLRYNYIFTLDGDDTVYTCTANRCSMNDFSNLGTISMNLYKMPQGFPRVANVVDQEILQEYVTLAEQNFRIDNIATDWTSVDNDRPYQQVQLYADGSVEVSRAVYEKADLNGTEAVGTDEGSVFGLILKILLGVCIAAIVVAGGILGWRYWQQHRKRQLQL